MNWIDHLYLGLQKQSKVLHLPFEIFFKFSTLFYNKHASNRLMKCCWLFIQNIALMSHSIGVSKKLIFTSQISFILILRVTSCVDC